MVPFVNVASLTKKAMESKLALWWLNFLIARTVPFNRPHGFKIETLGEEFIQTSAACRRSNHNHLRGIHACAIATIAEFSAGYLLMASLDAKKYRLIMSKIEVEYVYQAKKDILSESRMSRDRLETEVLEPLQHNESTEITMGSQITDVSGNAVATAQTTWQVKRWKKVKTKV